MIKAYQEYAPDPILASEWTGNPEVNSLSNWNPDIRVGVGRWYLKDSFGQKSTLAIGDFIIKENGVYKVCERREFLEKYAEL
jgi:hypothetical protein